MANTWNNTDHKYSLTLNNRGPNCTVTIPCAGKVLGGPIDFNINYKTISYNNSGTIYLSKSTEVDTLSSVSPVVGRQTGKGLFIKTTFGNNTKRLIDGPGLVIDSTKKTYTGAVDTNNICYSAFSPFLSYNRILNTYYSTSYELNLDNEDADANTCYIISGGFIEVRDDDGNGGTGSLFFIYSQWISEDTHSGYRYSLRYKVFNVDTNSIYTWKKVVHISGSGDCFVSKFDMYLNTSSANL